MADNPTMSRADWVVPTPATLSDVNRAEQAAIDHVSDENLARARIVHGHHAIDPYKVITYHAEGGCIVIRVDKTGWRHA